MKKLYNFSLIIAILFCVKCTTEDIEPSLQQIKDVDTSVNELGDLEGLLKGALNRMTLSSYYGRDFIINDEIRGDNVFANGNSGRFQTQGTYKYIPSNGIGIWLRGYSVIAISNIIINADESKLKGDANKIKHIKGQALILRALSHFDLLRNYGEQFSGGTNGVPYIKEFKGEEKYPSRNSVEEVRNLIKEDLNNAFEMMDNKFDDLSKKQYPSKYTAKAIASRLAIYFEDWSEAISSAKMVIDSGKYSVASSDTFVGNFKKDSSSNSIFELANSDVNNQGNNSLGFIYKGSVYGDIEVLPVVEKLYDDDDVRSKIMSFEGEKLRNLGKYPNLNGYDNIPIIRIEEVILNYAEALFESGQKDLAIEQLNKITSKRKAKAYSGTITKEDILNERRKELIFEGFRFFDLSRSGNGIPIVHELQNIDTPIKNGDYRFALPIPLTEIDANSNIVQNKGY